MRSGDARIASSCLADPVGAEAPVVGRERPCLLTARFVERKPGRADDLPDGELLLDVLVSVDRVAERGALGEPRSWASPTSGARSWT